MAAEGNRTEPDSDRRHRKNSVRWVGRGPRDRPLEETRAGERAHVLGAGDIVVGGLSMVAAQVPRRIIPARGVGPL